MQQGFAEGREDQFRISPVSCVTEQGPCTTQVTLSWRINTDGTLCLHVNGDSIYAICQLPTEHQVTLEVRSAKSIKFRLFHQTNVQVLHQAELQVYRPHKRKPRRRIAWSLF
ncbi:DUF3019 domain-containing protein [Shewanella sp. 125m-1]